MRIARIQTLQPRVRHRQRLKAVFNSSVDQPRGDRAPNGITP